MVLLRVFAGLLLLALASGSSLSSISADSKQVKWVGRVQPSNGGVTFDWEGVSATVTVANFTYLVVKMSDQCVGTSVGGGSRWGVTMNTSNEKAATMNHRIQTFYSGGLVDSYYMFNNPGGKCNPYCDFQGETSFSLIRLTESRISGCTPTNNLTVLSFSSDGTFVDQAPTPTTKRRIEFVGDSITAGNLNDGGQVKGGGSTAICANSAFNDDITFSSGAILCSALLGFDADCMYTAWGGIQLGVGSSWGMTQLYPYTFSALGTTAREEWDFKSFEADAVVINLGTNGGWRANQTAWMETYVQYGLDTVHKYYANPHLVLFLAYGPMTTSYKAMVLQVVASLKAAGIKANALDLTIPNGTTGCYHHPSHADNIAIAAKAKPQIAQVMGWSQ
jgi:hypothetical protein